MTRTFRSSCGGPWNITPLINLEDTLARFTSPAAWRSAMIRSTILERLVRRLAAEKNAVGDSACARVIASAPSDQMARGRSLWRSMRHCASGGLIPSRRAWHKRLVTLADHDPGDMTLTRLAAARGAARQWKGPGHCC